jgi:hypothetical protein
MGADEHPGVNGPRTGLSPEGGAARWHTRHGWRAWGALGVALVGVAVLDRSPSDIANQATLLALLLVGFAVGRWLRQGLPYAALLVGSSIALSRALGLLLGWETTDPSAPKTWAQVASLLVLNAPVLLVAGLGQLIRRRSGAAES